MPKSKAASSQREGARLLRKELGAYGYFIFPVARRFRKHKSDFVAVPKRNPCELLLIQMSKKGAIVTHPFASFRLDTSVRDAMRRARKQCGAPIRSGIRLLSKRASLRPEHLLTEKSRKDLKLLMGIDLYEKTRST